MTTHIAKAEKLLESSRRIIRNNDGVSQEAAEVLAEAQVEAALAVAEQLRIANLIALYTAPDEGGILGIGEVDQTIKEGLGL